MKKTARLVVCAVMLLSIDSCATLEQATPTRDLRLSVRSFGPETVTELSQGFCDDVAESILFTAIPENANAPGPKTVQPIDAEPFDPIFDQDDSPNPAPPQAKRPAGCFVDAEINLGKGLWRLQASQSNELGDVIWQAECGIFIFTDENSTNSPIAGFNANGSEYDGVGPTDSCAYEAFDLVVGRLFP